jgi:hypothetical protein
VKNIFVSFFQKMWLPAVIPPRQEGRFAIVTDVGRGAVAAMAGARRASVAADGEVVWSWHPDADAKFAMTLARRAGDGGQQARRTEESTYKL